MDKKPKDGRAKKKAIRKKKAPDEKQFERFIETARKLEVDDTGKEFERAFDAALGWKKIRQNGAN